MSTPSSLNANIPPPNVPFIDGSGRVNQVWWMFLLQLFRRTGAELGGDGQLTVGDVLALEADIPVPVDIAAEVVRLGIALQQVFAAFAAIQQAGPAFGEVWATPSTSAALTEMTLAPGAPQSSMSEMTFPSV
ncbi:MAG: hypothetical protein V4801_02400 [Burkholderia gladioli]